MFIEKANKDAREKRGNKSRYTIGYTRFNCVTYIQVITSCYYHLLRVRTQLKIPTNIPTLQICICKVHKQLSRYSNGVRPRRPRNRESIPGVERDYSLLHNVQNGSGTHPASYPIVIGGSPVRGEGVKWSGREADHSPPSSTEIKKKGDLCLCPPYVSRVWCLIKQVQEQFHLCASHICTADVGPGSQVPNRDRHMSVHLFSLMRHNFF